MTKIKVKKPIKYPPFIRLLDNTKQLIGDPKKWIKGQLRTVKPSVGECYCLVGALQTAKEREEVSYRAYGLAVAAIKKNLPPYKDDLFVPSIPGYNDKRSTKHSDIMDLLDKTIRKAKRKHRERRK